MWKPLNITKEEIANAERLFSKKAKFIVDEGVDRLVVNYLKEKGWNTKTTSDVGLSGHSDEDINMFSFKKERIILTHDKGFLDDHRFPFQKVYGIIILPGGSGDLWH
jgi:predicted nuclease of predicted toxin-antitoxin system